MENEGRKQRLGKRAKELKVRDMIAALCLCHNVTPVFEDAVRSFQASSPDEIALVNISERLGFTLVSRTSKEMVISNPASNERYEIVYEFPFTSQRKRMGIVLKPEHQSGYYFYLKGADVIMKSKVHEVQKCFLLDECEMLSREGLRTLVIT